MATVGEPASERDDGHLQTRPAQIPVLHFRETFGHFERDCNGLNVAGAGEEEDEGAEIN
jgi:hypothetical protein